MSPSSSVLRSRAAASGCSADGLAVLRALGLGSEALARGGRVVGLEAKTAGGRTVLDLSYADLHPAAHGLGIRRGVLFDLLHGG